MDDEADRLTRFDFEWREGDREVAKGIARSYVAARGQELRDMLGGKTLEQCVALVEQYREERRVADRLVVDMWLLTQFEPQHIKADGDLGARELAEAVSDALARGERIE